MYRPQDGMPSCSMCHALWHSRLQRATARLQAPRLLVELEISVVLVCHDLAQDWRMADWVVRIDAGRVVPEGPVEEHLVA